MFLVCVRVCFCTFFVLFFEHCTHVKVTFIITSYMSVVAYSFLYFVLASMLMLAGLIVADWCSFYVSSSVGWSLNFEAFILIFHHFICLFSSNLMTMTIITIMITILAA